MSTSIVISLIGRPNVGKSTIFNRLMHSQFKAITYDKPGVTRDRHYGILNVDEETSAILVDTGGFYPTHIEASGNTLEEQQFNTFFNIMGDQAKIAIDESDLVLLVVDAREGMNPFDQNICDYVRRTKKQFWVLVNKFDSMKQEGAENEFYAMGIDQEQIITLSAAHGIGFEGLRDRLKATIMKEEEVKKNITLQNGVAPVSEVVANVAIIGAPNAGKSTLLNRLLGANRALVSDIPGTTVDPIEGYFELYFGDDVTALKSYKNELLEKTLEETVEDADLEASSNTDESFDDVQTFDEEAEVETSTDDLEYKIFDAPEQAESTPEIVQEAVVEGPNPWRTVKLVDTAGIRKQKNVSGFIESQSVIRSLKAITDADVVIYMVDATVGITHQDRRLCDIALEKGKSLILCLNKIDLVSMNFQDRKKRKDWTEELRHKIPWLDFCELITISAKQGGHINFLKLNLAKTVLIRHKKLGTGELNRVINELVDKNPIIMKNSRNRFKVKYASMIKASPPTFLLFSNKSKNIPDNYRRYLVKGIRKSFALVNTPVHLIFRTGADLENRLKGMEEMTSTN
ncbi:MAG: ribosome biogenesis GTPase Der [Bacteriovoracaceae bacterium]